jgi:hypothetical protein
VGVKVRSPASAELGFSDIYQGYEKLNIPSLANAVIGKHVHVEYFTSDAPRVCSQKRYSARDQSGLVVLLCQLHHVTRLSAVASEPVTAVASAN